VPAVGFFLVMTTGDQSWLNPDMCSSRRGQRRRAGQPKGRLVRQRRTRHVIGNSESQAWHSSKSPQTVVSACSSGRAYTPQAEVVSSTAACNRQAHRPWFCSSPLRRQRQRCAQQKKAAHAVCRPRRQVLHCPIQARRREATACIQRPCGHVVHVHVCQHVRCAIRLCRGTGCGHEGGGNAPSPVGLQDAHVVDIRELLTLEAHAWLASGTDMRASHEGGRRSEMDRAGTGQGRTSATQTPFSVLAHGPALHDTSRQPTTSSPSAPFGSIATKHVQASEVPTAMCVRSCNDLSSRSANSRMNVGKKRLGNGRLCCSRSVS
jgi:hypothetical protein